MIIVVGNTYVMNTGAVVKIHRKSDTFVGYPYFGEDIVSGDSYRFNSEGVNYFSFKEKIVDIVREG